LQQHLERWNCHCDLDLYCPRYHNDEDDCIYDIVPPDCSELDSPTTNKHTKGEPDLRLFCWCSILIYPAADIDAYPHTYTNVGDPNNSIVFSFAVCTTREVYVINH
jgi:hypothetical protein